MATTIQHLKKAWRVFARDEPGQRFIRHYRRSQRNRSWAKTAARLALGTLLTAAGMMMWVLPGPGWLFVVFGLAMFASESRMLSDLLDRAELVVRAQLRRILMWWRSASLALRAAAVMAVAAIVAGLGSAAAWMTI